jgi:hypothetical protein
MSDSKQRVASWIDGFNLSLSFAIVICGQTILWLVISLLLLFYTLSELAEMFALRIKYFSESSNYCDIAMILLTCIVLFVPQEMIWNPKTLSIFDEDREKGGSGCGVKRGISALIIVLVCSRFMMSLAQCPSLKNYNLFMIMFCRVIRTSGKIMVWFVGYIISFGLGFYIMLHNDTEDTASKRDEPNRNLNETSSSCNCPRKPREQTKFDAPFLTLTKHGQCLLESLTLTIFQCMEGI